MGIKYVTKDWIFLSAEFAKAIRENVKEGDYSALGDLVGVDAMTVARWATNTHRTRFNHPRMSNFLAVCNTLDLDPRQFFGVS